MTDKLREAANQARLALAGHVSAQSAIDLLDAALSATPQPKPKQMMCDRCDGSGYVWAAGNCPDCGGDGWIAVPQPDAVARLVEALRDENERSREVLIHTAASLAAAISLLERGGKSAKKAAPSDKIFDQMLEDYRVSLEIARAALAPTTPSDVTAL